MRSTPSTKLRRIVAVAGALVACAAGVASVVVLLDGGERAPMAGDPTVTTRPVTGPRLGAKPPVHGQGVVPSATVAPSVDDLLAELKDANAAFTSPTSMSLGDTTEVELLVSRDRAIAELKQELAQAGALDSAEIRVSDTMEAQLSGVGFAIEPITPAVQLVPGEGTTLWKWAVEAKDSGKMRLHLTLTAVLNQDGRDRQYTIRTFARTLEVDVAFRDRLSGFVGGNWQWLWATLLVPLVGWLVQQRRHRRSAQEPPPSALQP